MGKRGDNHDYCVRCIAQWHEDNNIDPNIPCGDFDDEDDFRGFPE